MPRHSPELSSAYLPSPAAGEGPAPLRILVVDDELLIRWSVAETLVAAGHRVFEAGDAGAARRVFDAPDARLDVVLLDYRLPDNDDLSLLADVRRRSPHTAVVMMTAFGSPEMTEDARRLGAYAVLQKPFDVGRLEQLLVEAHSARAARPR